MRLKFCGGQKAQISLVFIVTICYKAVAVFWLWLAFRIYHFSRKFPEESGNPEMPSIITEIKPTCHPKLFRVGDGRGIPRERYLAAPKVIEDLINIFDSDPDFYRSIYFNETEVRTQFINPFFEALGWDVYHKCRPDNRDVKEEDAVKVEGKTKNPDYSFRLFEKRKFFVEVKRPSINIESGVYPAYQIRSYAWSADLPISILTDFEEFSVYYCRSRPSKDDKSTKSRLLYFRYDQYAEKWPEIAALFSRDAVLNGSLDKYVASLPQKRGDERVDAALLEDISKWREMLAKNIALRNAVDTPSLNYSVQAIIDRIMFLRICEDRGIEQYMRLKDLLNGERVYPRLCELFRRADERYNSGIFHFKKEPGRDNPDTITLNLNIDDDTLKEIIKHLYFPESPYAFSVLPAEILGQIYEQFLGKVIRLDESHNAWVEDKPEVKKAGGVKYTPVYIVEAIVSKTLGPTLKGRTPLEVVLITVLDPACGSGSFLIVAYQYLLDWHRDWYVQNLVPLLQSGLKPSSPEIRRLLPGVETGKKGRKKEPELPIYQGRDGEWKLTTTERKRILLNNIYGVDIDRQAVEVTKLSLLLKVLEGENEETISKQLTLFQERALPDLSNNIKCGNSLIGWDILKDNPSLTQEEIGRINPFDWEKEFPEIFQRGGFSVVIGNPPYVRQEGIGEFKGYFQKHYTVYQGTADLYAYFIERGVSLLREGGIFSYIVANKWMRANYGLPLRAWLKEQCIEEIIDFGDLQVFQGATTYPCIIRITKSTPHTRFDVTQMKTLDFQSLNDYVKENHYSVNQSDLNDKGWSLSDERTQKLLGKIYSKGVPLGEYVSGEIYYGIKTGLNEAFVIDVTTKERLTAEDARSAELIKPFLAGRDIQRYESPRSDKYLIFTRHGVKIEDYLAIKQYLSQFKDRLMPRPKDFKGDKWKGRKPGAYQWYEIQDTIDYYEEFEKNKILWPGISAQVAAFAFDDKGYYGNDNNQLIISEDKYLLGILNSSLIRMILMSICDKVQGGFYRLKIIYVEQLPVHTTDLSDPADVARHDRMVSLVDQMLSLHKQLKEARTPHEQTSLQRQIEATDGQIDALVYKLYGLTGEEIRVVDGT
jgi:hypothetical protein